MSAEQIIDELQKIASPERAKVTQKFFKTGVGQYGEGDIFIGGKVPEIRKIAVKHKNADINIIKQLLHSKIHEHRLCALFILVEQMNLAVKNKDQAEQTKIFNFTIEHKS